MSGTASTPEPTGGHRSAPGNMRPVHDGADPEGEARERAESRVRGVLSWLTYLVAVAVGVLLSGFGAGGVWWVVTLLLACAAVLVLELVVWPRVVRRATPWLLARHNRRNAP